MRDKIILYSGGMDSTVLLNEYKNEIKLALIFNYGSKHNKIENEMAKYNCFLLDIPYRVIDLDFKKLGIKSSLLDGEVPHGHFEDIIMKSTVVPFRNGIMISYAAAIAEDNDCKYILLANHFGDRAIYPDCRKEFIEGMTNAVKYGTYNNIEILAPFTNVSKREIGLLGKTLDVDFKNTYSCYEGEEIHCGECGTCVERKEALEGFDPTIYKI